MDPSCYVEYEFAADCIIGLTESGCGCSPNGVATCYDNGVPGDCELCQDFECLFIGCNSNGQPGMMAKWKSLRCDAIGDSCCGGDSCFTTGTKIATPGGETKIENLEPGDAVISFDPDTGSTSTSTVSQNYSRTVDEYYIVKTASGKEIKVTGEHPLFTGSEPQSPKTTLQKLQQLWFNFQTNIKYGWEEVRGAVGI